LFQGAQVNAPGNNGKTSLNLASRDGHLTIVEFLVENGGHLEAMDDQGNTALHYAARQGHVSIVKVQAAECNQK